MARIQYLAGMRPGEICALRSCDINRSKEVWEFDYKEHKTAHHGHDRTIWFGRRAQEILTSYLMDAEGDPEKYLFSPRDSVRMTNMEKRKKRKTKVQPSQRCRAKKEPKIGPGTRYEVQSYRRALQRAAKKAGVERWSPNQLRHTRATEIRKDYGLEAAQIILGHEKADVTQIYAERDKEKGIRIMREIG
jgi:integrase